MRATTRIILLGLVGTSTFVWIPPASAASGDVQARIENFAFAPDPINVPVGASVTWTNHDSTFHTVTADDASFDSGHKGPNATFTQAFPVAGTITYHCNIHSGMTGTIVVGDGGSGPTTTTTAAPTTTTTAAPTTSTTVRVTTTTAAAPQTTTAPKPTATTAKPTPTTAPKPTATTARPTPTTARSEAPATSPATTPAPLETSPSTEVAAGVTTPDGSSSRGNGAGTAMAAAAAALLLGGAAAGTVRYRRGRSTP